MGQWRWDKHLPAYALGRVSGNACTCMVKWGTGGGTSMGQLLDWGL